MRGNNIETWQMYRSTSVRRSAEKNREKQICPCCRQSVTGCPILVSLDGNTVTIGGETTSLTAHETEIVHTLAAAWPGRASLERIADAVWGAYGYRPRSPNVLRVYMTSLRKKLKPLGATIDNVRGSGYGLVVVN